MRTIKDGSFTDPSIWDTSGGDRIILHNVFLDTNATVKERIYLAPMKHFEFRGAVLTMDAKNFSCDGNIVSRPVAGKNSGIDFININENLSVGGGMIEMPNDIGLWVFAPGSLDIEGTFKTPFTFCAGNARRGDKQVTVKNQTGWLVGDEIVICPTEKSTWDQIGWDTADTVFSDPFFETRFETRKITAISGNVISFADALLYDHMEVKSSLVDLKGVGHSRHWTAEVANLTRDFKIRGTASGRAHIFMSAKQMGRARLRHATAVTNIKNIEGAYLGQRKSGRWTGGIISGRYGCHFHHQHDGSIGSIVEGCSFHHIGNRCFVPHRSNGITFKNNVCFDVRSQGFWWDDQESSHNIIWDGNLAAACRPDGYGFRGSGFLLGMGDDNICTNNIAVYCNSTEPHNNNGAFAWNANSEGVWIFHHNLAHSSTTPFFVWQNTGQPHSVNDFDTYNNWEMEHGAYGNVYGFNRGYHVNSMLHLKAASGNEYGVVFKDILWDAAGAKYAVRMVDSPIPSDYRKTNKFIGCTMGGFTVAGIECASGLPMTHPEKQWKAVDLIDCKFYGEPFVFVHNDPEPLKDNYRGRLQPATGQAYQIQRVNQQDVRSNINHFTTHLWGTGNGLRGEYFEGENFEKKVFERIDINILFQGWAYDSGYAPYGVHHLLPGDVYSIRWTGQIERQFNEPYQFAMQGAGGHRLWIDDKLVIDVWVEHSEGTDFYYSANVTLGTKSKIKAEHFNNHGQRGCSLYWKSASMEGLSVVPQPQLYTSGVETVYKNVRMEQNFTRNNCPAGATGSAVVYVVPANKYSSTISQADADRQAQDEINAHGQHNANVSGTCSIVEPPPTDPCLIYIENDYLDLQPDVADAVDTGRFETGWEHYVQYGKAEKRRANKLCLDPTLTPPVQTQPGTFKSVQKQGTFTRNNCPAGQSGSQVVYIVPAGKYESTVSQADADQKAQADVEANGQANANTNGTCTTTPPVERQFILSDIEGVEATFDLLGDGTLKLNT